ncbi:hypothetical protein SDC9_35848 [bioreactor metagenome]|uniref:Acid-resistance membrane protein n=1 Tax=bioreactor metagenome TaxID=1076179 RepID=A0A644VEP0_9ZZZZ|nr:DUF308 domain-containing protein [Methanocorpusculum sp.]
MTSVVIIEQELNPNAWKFQILKAVIFVLFGVFCLVFPFSTLNLGAYLVAFFLLFVSIAALFSGFAAFGEPKTTWWMIVLGIIGIIIAGYSFLNPAFMITFGTICVGIIALLSGLTDIILAFSQGLSAGIRVLTFILGVLGLLVGLVFLLQPGMGAEVLIVLLGIFLIAGGIVALIEGFMFKKFMSEVTN